MAVVLDIKKTVKKSNILNELRNANTSMAEYRLFCVYLAHLPMNSENNVVTFTLADYARIAGLDRPRYVDIKTQAENIVGRVASLPNEDGGFSTYSLFTEFKLHKKDDQWMVSLECSPRIAPMIREQRGHFLRYKLYNTVRLKSYNQQRIYELLKQYERIGVRFIELQELREFLSVGSGEYPVWGDFAQKVLKVAQKALKEHTDICFDYEPVKKGRKVTAVKFAIQKNDSFVDQLDLDEFLPSEEIEIDGDDFEVESRELDGQMSFDDIKPQDPEEESELAFFREALSGRGRSISNAELEELLEIIRSTEWYLALAWMDPHNKDMAVQNYLKLHDRYTESNGRTYMPYMRTCLPINAASVPTPEKVEDDWRSSWLMNR